MVSVFYNKNEGRVQYDGLAKDEKPVQGVPNGAYWYTMDWNSLSEAEQAGAQARVWEFDEENKKWHPQ